MVTHSLRRGRVLAGLLLVCAGLVRSAQESFAIPVDSDRATAALMVEAMRGLGRGSGRGSGLAALASWHATQDNWLFSALLPQAPFYVVFGSKAWLPALTGWLGFVVVCAAAGLLAALAIGAPRGRATGLLLAGVLLFANPLSLGGIGFLAHPASHGVTLGWCLVALVPVLAVLRGGRAAWLACTSLLLLLATVSDPWAKAAFVLPVDLAAAVMLAGAGAALRRTALLVVLATLPTWLAGSHLFGLMPGLPGGRFERGSIADVPGHVRVGLDGLSILLDMVPGPDPLRWHPARLGSLAMVLAVSALAIRPGWRLLVGRGAPERRFLLLFGLASMATTLAAFSVSAMATALGMTRLLCNVAVLLPLVLAVVAAGSGRSLPRVLVAAAALFVATGLSLDPVRLARSPGTAQAARMLAFLEAHGLSNGYGGYWSSQANASRLLSGGRVTIRPVAVLGPPVLQPRDGQVFDSWYRAGTPPGDRRADGSGRRFFVALPDPELCATQAECVRLAERTFGPADRILDWENHPVLVWDRPALPPVPLPFQTTDRPRLRPGVPLRVDAATGRHLLWSGWSGLGPDGAWSVDRHPGILFEAAAPGTVCLLLRASGRSTAPVQAAMLRDGGAIVARWRVTAGAVRSYCSAPLPAGPVFLSLDRPDPPGDNQRLLPGLQLSAVELHATGSRAAEPGRISAGRENG